MTGSTDHRDHGAGSRTHRSRYPKGMLRVMFAAALLLVAVPAAALARDFDNPASPDTSQQFAPGSVQRDDTPNDPGYDAAEPDDPDNGGATNLYDERFDLFGFPSALTETETRYREGPHGIGGSETTVPNTLLGDPQVSGFNAAGAWKLERGRPDAVVAILDTGIKWDRESLRLQIHLNTDELPKPADDGATCTGSNPYDCNDDGAVTVADYQGTSVDPAAGAHGDPTKIDAEDLIATYSDGIDGGPDGGNGYVDDIAGWDFFDNDNDPYDASSYFAASNHGSARATNAAERGNDGAGEIGVCPRCQVMPIRTWDTFVSDGNTFGMGILYGADNGASVIEGANGSVYHSAFAEAASQYAYDKGVVQTYSGDDLNTANHNYPGNYGHAMLIQGTVPDTVGLGTDAGPQFRQALCDNPILIPLGVCLGSELPVGTYFRGANTTQFGGKSSIALEGSTGSENTGKAAGAAALVISAARNASPRIDLLPDETREILEQTAERVTGDPLNPASNVAGLGQADPGADPNDPPEDQWTSHFGWGRVDLGRAVALARGGKIPPEAAIDSPDWYAPQTGDAVEIKGLARARFATGGQFDWKLEWGVGQAPTGSEWHTVGSGSSSGTVTDFGTVDLNAVRAALASYTPPPDPGGPTFSTTAPNPLKDEFAVRLTVTGDGIQTDGIDRRVLSSVADPDLHPGFPKRMGTGGEAPPRYADINGDNVQELILPTEDGTVHAYEPDGSELPGWPVHTRQQIQAEGHGAAPGFSALAAATPPREPPRGPTVADLDDDGRPEVITAAGTRIYVWEPDGTLRDGFPVQSELGNCAPSLQSQPLEHPKCGFVATPAVARLDGPGKPPSIMVPGLDGYLYAFDADGGARSGYPLRLVDPAVPDDEQMIAESINEPAIGDLTGDGVDDVVVATNETYDATPPDFSSITGGLGNALSAILANAAGGSDRVYAIDGASGQYLPGWPIAINGAIQTTLPLIGPGNNPAIATIGGQPRVVASATGSATIGIYNADGTLLRGIEQEAPGAASPSDGALPFGSINLFESASVGKLIPGGSLDVVKYSLGVTDAVNLLLTGQNLPYNHLIGAYSAQTGVSEPSFPRVTDDYQFLSSSNVANVTGSSTSNQVLAGTALGLLHAYDGITGLDAPGFPKSTGGWLFAPAALSDDGRMADITREGYLFQWDLPDLPKCQSEWPSFRHDQQGSGNYDRDGTQPYKPTSASASGSTLTFTAPGDDYGCGTADHYEIATSATPITPQSFASARPLDGAPDPQTAGSQQSYSLPAHERYVGIRAVDEAGNVGWTANVDTAPAAGGGSGGGGGNVGGPGGGGGGASRQGTCRGKQARVVQGAAAAEKLIGTAGRDLIRGGRGNDSIKGLEDDDCLFGQADDDKVKGNGGRDVIAGGSGDDRIKGNNGRDVIDTGPGSDRANGGGSRDMIKARGGEDRIKGGNGGDALKAGGGGDRVNGNGGNDKINGGGGNDVITDTEGRNVIKCGKGEDKVVTNSESKLGGGCERIKIKKSR